MTSSVMTFSPRRCASATKLAEVLERAVVGMHVGVVGDVVAVVAQRRRIERQQPDRVDAELLDVVEPLGQPGEVADAVAVGVVERLDVHLIDDGVLVPERVIDHGWLAVPLTWLQRLRYARRFPHSRRSARAH